MNNTWGNPNSNLRVHIPRGTQNALNIMSVFRQGLEENRIGHKFDQNGTRSLDIGDFRPEFSHVP